MKFIYYIDAHPGLLFIFGERGLENCLTFLIQSKQILHICIRTSLSHTN